MAPSPTPSSPRTPSSRGRVGVSQRERAASAGPEARGTRTRRKTGARYGGACSNDDNDANNEISDDSTDGWRARTYPTAPAASSSPNRRRIRRPPARRAQSVGREATTLGRDRSPTPAAVYSDGDDDDAEDGFARRGRAKPTSPNVDTRRRAARDTAGRSTGDYSRRQSEDRWPRSRSPGRLAGGAPRRGKAGERWSGQKVVGKRSRGGSVGVDCTFPLFSKMISQLCARTTPFR